jgi:hypothetical protein
MLLGIANSQACLVVIYFEKETQGIAAAHRIFISPACLERNVL